MSRSFLRRHASTWALALVFIAGPVAISAGEPECKLVEGRVDFVGLEVVPPAPVVGDRVELRFDVELAVYFVSSVRLLGAAPLLEGETVSRTSDTTFVLDAVEPGHTTLQLEVAHGTEEYCPSIGAWYVGPILTKTSRAFDISIGTTGNPSFTPAPSTPTATNTPTPAAVCTPPFCPDGVLVCPDVCPGGCGTICQSAGDLPDLIPSFAEVNLPSIGCVRDFSEIPPPETIFCVRNQGAAPSTGFDVVLEMEPAQRIESLAAGAQTCLTGPFFGSSVSVSADVGNEVTESDETNNTQTLSFVVPTATPPPLCTATATASPTPTIAVAVCPGDCDGDGNVSVSELMTAVNIFLGNQSVTNCRAVDTDGDGRVTVSELVRAVRRNLEGCSSQEAR